MAAILFFKMAAIYEKNVLSNNFGSESHTRLKLVAKFMFSDLQLIVQQHFGCYLFI